MHIIDFDEKKRQKEAIRKKEKQSKLVWQLQQTGKQQYLLQLVNDTQLDYEAHQLFLAFIKTVESEKLQTLDVFSDAIKMTRREFHAQYHLDWWTSLQCALTFLVIQKETNQQSFEKHIDYFIPQ